MYVSDFFETTRICFKTMSRLNLLHVRCPDSYVLILHYWTATPPQWELPMGYPQNAIEIASFSESFTWDNGTIPVELCRLPHVKSFQKNLFNLLHTHLNSLLRRHDDINIEQKA